MARHTYRGPRCGDRDAACWYVYQVKMSVCCPSVYVVSLYGDKETPLTKDGRLVLFRRIKDAERLVRRHASSLSRKAKFGDRGVSLRCDFPQLVDAVVRGSKDEESKLLNTLNALLELLDASDIRLPDAYRERLGALANHLTFRDDIDKFFASSNHQRRDIVDALVWGVGSISTRSLLL